MRITLALIALLGVAAAPAPKSLPGPDAGAWDYARVDPSTHRLYVARSSSVSVFDLTGKAPARSIGAISHGHGVLPIPGSTNLLVTSGDDGTVRIMSSQDGHDIAVLKVGLNPDAAAIDAAQRRAYVMNAKSGSVSVIDLAANKVIKTIPLKPGLEFGAIAGGTLFINDEDSNELETVDIRTLTASQPVALPGCEAPSGLAYDARTGLLVSACDNGKAAIVDAKTRKLKALLPIGEGPDAVMLDEARRVAYVPGGKSGDLTVIALDGAKGPHVVHTVKTEAYARTGALDPRDGTVYLPTAKLGTPAPGAKRGAPIPGSFHILAIPHAG
jgi:YVTN family beta-propeller protein